MRTGGIFEERRIFAASIWLYSWESERFPGFLTNRSMNTFEKLKQAALYTSRMVFPVVWTGLFAMMGTAFTWLQSHQNWREKEGTDFIRDSARCTEGQSFSLTQDGICLRLPGCCFQVSGIICTKAFSEISRTAESLSDDSISLGWLLWYLAFYFCWTDIKGSALSARCPVWLCWNWCLTMLWKSRNIDKEYA